MVTSRAVRPLIGLFNTCARHQTQSQRCFSTTLHRRYAEESNLPRIATTSFWASLIPKPFRSPTDPVEAAERAKLKASKTKEWNPATIFLILGILVGSNAIQLIALRNEMLNFSRKTDAKLSLLREVVQRVKKGEDVDVRKALGTGDPQQEAEWEEVMKELEETDMSAEWEQKRTQKRAQKVSQRRSKESEDLAKAQEREGPSPDNQTNAQQGANDWRPKFLM